MNEDRLRTALKRTYHVPAVSADARTRILGRVPAPQVRRAFRLGRPLALAAGICLVAWVGVPVARANYTGRSLAAKLRGSSAYTVTITVAKKQLAQGEHIRTTPVIASVANGVCTTSNSNDGDQFYIYEPGRMLQFRKEDGRSIVRPPNSSMTNLLALPDKIADQLGRFQLDKKVEELGKVSVHGRPASEIEVASGASRVVVDIDSATGTPVRMRLHVDDTLPDTIFDYDRDEAKAKRVVASRQSLVKEAPVLDIGNGREELCRSIAASPVTHADTGRDQLTIYRIESNREGDIFVLYAFQVYHGAEDRLGSFLRLEDSRGTPWLSDVVDLSFSKLKLDGQFAKGQVFFHPRGEVSAKSVRLFAKMRDWEFVTGGVVQPEPEDGARRRELGTFTPQAAPAGQPDWIYYAFNFDNTGWLTADAKKLRFINALRAKDYAFAEKVGQEFEATFPEMMGGLFYDKAQLSLGLYHAFTGAGDRDKAREYLRKAIAGAGDLSGDYRMNQDLVESRRREGM